MLVIDLNRDILECKCITQEIHRVGLINLNRDILECKSKLGIQERLQDLI